MNAMKLVDVHCHLDDSQFNADLPQTIQRAIDAGVVSIITNALELNAYEPLLDLSKKYPIVKVALGIYPDNARDQSDAETKAALDFIKKNKDKIVAIGEIGLDHKYTTDSLGKEKQKKVFIEQLRLAKTLGKTVIIHTRDAEEECLQILAQEKQENVVLHCFCGTEAQVLFAKEHNWHFSVPVRAKTSKSFQKIIELLPMSLILTETDAPYLHYKQERNEPANVAVTVELIAKIKGMDKIEVANTILQNYIKLFSNR